MDLQQQATRLKNYNLHYKAAHSIFLAICGTIQRELFITINQLQDRIAIFPKVNLFFIITLYLISLSKTSFPTNRFEVNITMLNMQYIILNILYTYGRRNFYSMKFKCLTFYSSTNILNHFEPDKLQTPSQFPFKIQQTILLGI